MFQVLFTNGRTIDRHRRAPLLEERLRYLQHCAEAGARLSTLRTIAAHQTNLVHFLDLHQDDRVGVAQVEAAASQWSLRSGRRSKRPARPEARQQFFGHAIRWLRFVDMLEEPDALRHAHIAEVQIFKAWMREECGLSDKTICPRLNTVDRFFDGLEERGVTLAAVRISDIDREVARWHARGCGRMTVHNYAQDLRTFFRFAERRGWCTRGVAQGIMAPRIHPGGALPKGLDREDVLRLLATTEGSRPADVRDRGILMLLIAYGLRAGEVAGLRLDDFDWKDETLRVRRPKPGRIHHYPLSPGVGQAILRYLRELRPQRPERTLFLTLSAPLRPLSRSAMWHIVRSRLDRIGITGKRRGPHALRHSAAQHLLDHGLSMKEVGDYLGHRSVSATSTYAKVQLSALRDVAGIDLEGLA